MAASDSRALVIQVIRQLRMRRESLSFAESCTGGLLSSWVTEVPGVSDVFLGSIVAYAYDMKRKFLGVPDSVLKTLGAVSLPVARRMAEGARVACHSSWGVSITGIAGPGGGTPQKPVGTVCFGVSGPGVDRVDQQNFSGTRRQIQVASAEHALRLLLIELGMDEGLVPKDHP